MNNMNFKLPFYGKKGTIKDIKEDEKYYIVYRYGLTNQEESIFYVPKNDNNLLLLMNNYNNDLKEYLEINSNKYETYKQTRLKKDINKNSLKILFAISGFMILSSIALFGTHEPIGFVGVILDTIAIPTTIYATSEMIKKRKDEQKEKFIKSYNKMNHKYKIGVKEYIKEKEETKYKGIITDKEHNPVLDLTKVKKLTQEKNAA